MGMYPDWGLCGAWRWDGISGVVRGRGFSVI